MPRGENGRFIKGGGKKGKGVKEDINAVGDAVYQTALAGRAGLQQALHHPIDTWSSIWATGPGEVATAARVSDAELQEHDARLAAALGEQSIIGAFNRRRAHAQRGRERAELMSRWPVDQQVGRGHRDCGISTFTYNNATHDGSVAH